MLQHIFHLFPADALSILTDSEEDEDGSDSGSEGGDGGSDSDMSEPSEDFSIIPQRKTKQDELDVMSLRVDRIQVRFQYYSSEKNKTR